ncbi:c-type cytochrome [Shewanella eurypsychrophilus]|uniref:C-type cytochrome n=1 Tax=Shewanella eurypsychrophilus TaxID=2593656 RepID=A0ABX6V499_9GAMM|nr:MULTISPECIES: c-type cytochrome [Shewanella]QFU22197.1 c-type cytochrome [Shewanella sp. YLB-09]QPG57483.1 c-type cytochrome [Shewanella eurypsychrophilus]
MFVKTTLTLLGLLYCGQAFSDTLIPGAPAWSTPVRGSVSVSETSKTPQQLTGSNKTYTQLQIDDKFNAPDWYPSQHAVMPDIVKFGKSPKVWACSSCHLASGLGHPESSTLAGLSASYLTAQIRAFSNGDRLDYSGHMNRIAPLLSEQDILDAVNYFSSLPYRNFIEVVETQTVPETYFDQTRMRQVKHDGKQQAIGDRIIEVPKDDRKVALRDPYASFISYAPLGSVARGKVLVETGSGKTTACHSCHGSRLVGGPIGPSIAGNFGIYTVRQLYGFKAGTRKNSLMAAVVANLTEQDIIDIAAYLSFVTVTD